MSGVARARLAATVAATAAIATSSCDAPAVRAPAPAPAAAPGVDVIDLHVDTLFQIHFAGKRLGETQLALAPPPAGVVLSLYLPSGLRPVPVPGHLLPGLLAAAAELRARVPAPTWLSYEGPPPDEAGLAALLDAGVVIVGLAHAWHSDFADSATDPHPRRGGLTAAGVQAVRAIHSAGAVVDLAHLSPDAAAAVAALAAEVCAPLISTHTSARAIHDHPRGLDDDQLRAVSASGGLVGILVHAPILGGRDAERFAAHVAHAVAVAGVAHVAIGSDLDGNIRPIRGVASTADLPALAAALAAAGLDDAAIAAVLAGNARRFLARLPGRWSCSPVPGHTSPTPIVQRVWTPEPRYSPRSKP